MYLGRKNFFHFAYISPNGFQADYIRADLLYCQQDVDINGQDG